AREVGAPAAIQRGDETEGGSEQSQHAERGKRRCRHVTDEAQGEEQEIGRLATDPVRQRDTEKAAYDIEQGEQPDKGGTDQRGLRLLGVIELREAYGGIAEQAAAEGLLKHRGGRADDADTGGDGEPEHEPDQPTLQR